MDLKRQKRLRRYTIDLSIALTLFLFTCWLMRIQSLSQIADHAQMAIEFPGPWSQFAFRRVTLGDPIQKLISTTPAAQVITYGRYAEYKYADALSFSQFIVFTRDGKIIAAIGGSCTWNFTFFNESDPELDVTFKKYLVWRKYLRRLLESGEMGT
jgi:hypothetical protein